jgi:hypothetical protein
VVCVNIGQDFSFFEQLVYPLAVARRPPSTSRITRRIGGSSRNPDSMVSMARMWRL